MFFFCNNCKNLSSTLIIPENGLINFNLAKDLFYTNFSGNKYWLSFGNGKIFPEAIQSIPSSWFTLIVLLSLNILRIKRFSKRISPEIGVYIGFNLRPPGIIVWVEYSEINSFFIKEEFVLYKKEPISRKISFFYLSN